jgi:hypothetical protein
MQRICQLGIDTHRDFLSWAAGHTGRLHLEGRTNRFKYKRRPQMRAPFA